MELFSYICLGLAHSFVIFVSSWKTWCKEGWHEGVGLDYELQWIVFDMEKSALDMDIQFLPGVGPKRAELLRKELGVGTVGELLRLYPF